MNINRFVFVSPATVWIILLIVFVIVEIVSLGLTTIWFAAGALCAFFLQLLGFGLAVQIIAFIVVSVLLLIVTRPIATRYLNSRTVRTNAEALVGKSVRVTCDISNLKGEGQVIVGGIEWTARSYDDTVTFRKDDIVKVVGIEGVKLIVKPAEQVGV